MGVRSLAFLGLLGFSGCDCYGTHPSDGGAHDAATDAPGDAARDAALQADSGVDSGPGERRCQGPIDYCSADLPYCCRRDFDEFAPENCHVRPANPAWGANRTGCWEWPDPERVVSRPCGPNEQCPGDHPWCCSELEWSYCSVEPLYGWPCVDMDGVPADYTYEYSEELVRRCEEDEPCPEAYPYCCKNLFCAERPYHGWDCAIP